MDHRWPNHNDLFWFVHLCACLQRQQADTKYRRLKHRQNSSKVETVIRTENLSATDSGKMALTTRSLFLFVFLFAAINALDNDDHAGVEVEHSHVHGHSHGGEKEHDHQHHHGHSHDHHGHSHDFHHGHSHGDHHGHSHDFDHGHSHAHHEHPAKKYQRQGTSASSSKKKLPPQAEMNAKWTKWLQAIAATLLISAAPFFILFFIPLQSNAADQQPLLKVLLAFASGGLLGGCVPSFDPTRDFSALASWRPLSSTLAFSLTRRRSWSFFWNGCWSLGSSWLDRVYDGGKICAVS